MKISGTVLLCLLAGMPWLASARLSREQDYDDHASETKVAYKHKRDPDKTGDEHRGDHGHGKGDPDDRKAPELTVGSSLGTLTILGGVAVIVLANRKRQQSS